MAPACVRGETAGGSRPNAVRRRRRMRATFPSAELPNGEDYTLRLSQSAVKPPGRTCLKFGHRCQLGYSSPMSPKTKFNFMIEPAQLAALRQVEERTGAAVAEQIRRAINLWLAAQAGEQPAALTTQKPRRLVKRG